MHKTKAKEPLLRAVKTRLFCRAGFYLDVDPETCKIYGVTKKEVDDELRIRETAMFPCKARNRATLLKKSESRVSEANSVFGKTSKTSHANNAANNAATPSDGKTPGSDKSDPIIEFNNNSVIQNQGPNGSSSTSSTRMKGLFYLIPVGLRVVAIQHVDTGLYIAMCPDGRAYTCEMFTGECKFKEVCVEQTYVTYSQTVDKYPKRLPTADQKQQKKLLYLGISAKGSALRGSKAFDKETKKLKFNTHFLPQPIECIMMREPSSYEVIGGPVRQTTVGILEEVNSVAGNENHMPRSNTNATVIDIEN